MLTPSQILDIAALPTAFIHIVVPRAEVRTVMGPGLQELKAAVAAQGIDVTGPWFTHHRRMDGTTFDFEISLPVASPVAPAGRVQPGEWPAMKVIRTVYSGPFEQLGAAWGEFIASTAAAGHRTADDLWERYLVGPEATPDPAGWRTELTRRLIG